MKASVPAAQVAQESPAQVSRSARAQESVVESEVVQSAIGSPGQALSRGLRTDAERLLGHSFGRMRVGRGADASASQSYRLSQDSDANEQQAREIASQSGSRDASADPLALGDVHIHTDAPAAQAARALRARAFTVGDHIAFGPGQYSPYTSAGRGVLMHELAHVAQYKARGARADVIHRLTDDSQQSTSQTGSGAQATQKKPNVIQDNAAEQAQWRDKVDAVVRKHFGLKGAGIKGRTEFVDQATFAKKFPAGGLPEVLLSIFLSSGARGEHPAGQILDFNNVSYFINKMISERTLAELRAFIQKGIKDGFFEGQSRELDVAESRRTGKPTRLARFKVTPGELAAEHVGGVTDISGPRATHRILMQAPSWVSTLVHEVCHFYIDSAYTQMATARTDADDFIGDARISQILFEGVAEYFAREVMRANEAELGPVGTGAYAAEYEQAWRLDTTMPPGGLRAAYFRGDRASLDLLSAVVDEYKTTPPDLLIPKGYVKPKGKGKP